MVVKKEAQKISTKVQCHAYDSTYTDMNYKTMLTLYLKEKYTSSASITIKILAIGPLDFAPLVEVNYVIGSANMVLLPERPAPS